MHDAGYRFALIIAAIRFEPARRHRASKIMIIAITHAIYSFALPAEHDADIFSVALAAARRS